MSSKFDARQTKLVPAQAMIGSAANDTLDTVIPKINDELAKLFEDTNIVLAEGGTVSVNSTATSVTFSASLKLHVNSLVAGGSPKVIDLTSTTRAFTTDGNMLYAVIDRVTGTATVTADSATLPAVTSSNQEVVLIAKRIGTSIIFRNGVGIAADLSKTLDSATLGVNNLSVSTKAQSSVSTDTATGANATLTAPTTPIIRLTNGSLSSLDGIPAGVDGQEITLINDTGTTVTVNDNTGVTAANRFYTGLKKPLSLKDQASLLLRYSTATSRWRIIGGSGSGSGTSGAGGGELADILYNAAIRDSFSDIPDGTTPTDIGAAKTDGTLHDVANELFRLNYDATQTVTGTGTAMTLSGAPAFTIKTGDVLVVNSEARKITVLTSQTVFTIESAFTVDPSASACCVSQAVHTADLNNFDNGGLGLSAASQYTGNIDEILLGYHDSATLGDIIPDYGSTANIAFDASTDASAWTTTRTRVASLASSEVPVTCPTSNPNLYIRFFANKTSGSGAVNLLSYKAFFHKIIGQQVGATYYTAFARPTSSIAQNCTIGLVSGKTRFTFTFPYTRGLNAGEASGSVLEVIANGQVVPRFESGVTDSAQAYFIEINDNTIEMDTDYSAAGIYFQFKVTRVNIIDSNTQNTANIAANMDILDQAVDAQIIPTWLTAVNGVPSSSQFRSDITNRQRILDLSSALNVQMAPQRMVTQELYLETGETGPTGQQVFGVLNDRFDQIRFVGNWVNFNSNSGTGAQGLSQNDYVEIIFYGTALNVLMVANANARDIRVSVDGGAEGANIYTAASAVLDGRNYAMNTVVKAISGLSLGLHTVKIRKADNTATFYVFGFDVSTESTTLKVTPGTAIKGKYKNTLSVLQSPAYNSDFESGTLGTKGGRVLVYSKNDNTIAKALTPVDITALYLTSTNHINEEAYKTYHWREFGAGRADDFSRLITLGNYAFTSEDGVATLVGSNVAAATASDGLRINNTGGATYFFTITFEGTGLDIVATSDTAATTTNYALTVDGVAQGSITPTFTTVNTQFLKISLCSGLPYGTHTVKVSQSAVSAAPLAVTQFIVYQPKKPTLPAGAIEIGEYNIHANHTNSIAGTNAIGTGLMRKNATREVLLVGTWSTTLAPTVGVGGWELNTTTVGNYLEYTFFGEGLEIRGSANTNQSNNNPILINGLAATVANFPTLTSATYGGWAFAAGNLNQNAAAQAGAGLSLTGLPLGIYTIRITCNQAATAAGLVIDSLDIITPISFPSSNIPQVIQNTLPIGNISIGDLRKFNNRDVRVNNFKNTAQAFGISSLPTTTSTVAVPCPDLSVTHYNTTGRIKINYNINLQHGTTGVGSYTVIYVDGKKIGTEKAVQAPTATYVFENSDSLFLIVSPGYHKIDIYWYTSSGTLTATNTWRNLFVEEV